MEHWDFDNKKIISLSREVTFSCSNAIFNKELLRELVFACEDKDGYKYSYDLIDLIEHPSLFKD